MQTLLTKSEYDFQRYALIPAGSIIMSIIGLYLIFSFGLEVLPIYFHLKKKEKLYQYGIDNPLVSLVPLNCKLNTIISTCFIT